jgi:glycosyltransferase involved in cell wall biosynthesis
MSRLKIGFLPTGGRDWIAGIVVLQNLVASLRMLPAEEQPWICLTVGPGHQVDEHGRGAWMPALKHYTYGDEFTWKAKLRTTIRHHGLTRWPTSLGRLCRTLKLSALYPVHASLGPAFHRPWIGWIPDFQHKRMPEFFPEHEKRGRDAAFAQLIQDAPRVVVSSQDAYHDLMRWFPADPRKISVLSFTTVAGANWFAPDPAAFARELGLPRKYLMFPSQFWVHKNHRCLFQAVRLVQATCPDIALVCTGRMHDHRFPEYGDALLAETKRNGLEGRIHCLGLIDRQKQIQLLRASAAIVQPSFFEGWSSLVEDARALGKRIYVSDLPIHREQEPPDAEFFDPKSPEELAALIARDWPHLAPGPDLEKERAARSGESSRALAYARRFLTIVRETSGAD